MHWAQLLYWSATFESQFEAMRNKKVSYHPKPPNDTLLFLLYMLTTVISLAVFIYLQWQTEDFTSLSSLWGEATRGKSKDKREGKLTPPPTCFPPLTPLSSLHLPLYFINVSVWLFRSHQLLIISGTGSTAPFM